MKKYFKLHFNCKYQRGKKDGAIYNLLTKQLIKLNINFCEVLDKLEINNDEVFEEDYEVCNALKKVGLGSYYEGYIPCVDKMRSDMHEDINNQMEENVYISKVFIQVTNECDMNCIFCDNTDKILTSTGCKRWNNKTCMKLEDYYDFLQGVYKLGARVIEFIGGNPLLDFIKVCKIIIKAEKLGFTDFIIHSNLYCLNQQMLDFFVMHKVKLIVQILSCDNKKLKKLTGFNINYEVLKENIIQCLEKKIKVNAIILIGNFNEYEIGDIHKELESFNLFNIQTQYIYDVDNNQFYSQIYKCQMYDKSSSFCAVTKESYGYYSKYNSCFKNQLYLNTQGDITPCPMLNSIKLGNVKIECLNDIISKNLYKEIIGLSRKKIEGCSECAYNKACMDCRAIEYSVTKNLNKQHYCNFINISNSNLV